MNASGDDLKTKRVLIWSSDYYIGAKIMNIKLLICIQCLFQAREDNLQSRLIKVIRFRIHKNI